MKKLPSTEILSELLNYNPESGILIRIDRSTGVSNRGTDAGYNHSSGYKFIGINNSRYLLHRIIWKIMTGEDPSGPIDHINHDRTDNRWSNIRMVTGKDNSKNLSMFKRNTSGVTGVTWDKSRDKWLAQININGKAKHLGRYDLIADAGIARSEAEKAYGFHVNHGVIV